MKTKQFTLFDWLKCIINTKDSWDIFTPEQQKIFNGFMVFRFLSMNPKYIDIINYVQKFNIKDSKKLYELLCFLIPKSSRTYYPYVKSKSQNQNSETLKHISEYYECSTLEAAEYIELMGKDWVKNILESKGIDDKQVKVLLK